jgi:hypothetical protein
MNPGFALYRDAIAQQMPLLAQHGFSWLGEDDDGIELTDGQLWLSFCVQPREASLEVLVRHLGDTASDQTYRVDLVMRVMKDATTQDFIQWQQAGPDALVGHFVRYILDNRQRLFGAQCTYAQAYDDYNRQVMAQLMAQWAPKG